MVKNVMSFAKDARSPRELLSWSIWASDGDKWITSSMLIAFEKK